MLAFLEGMGGKLVIALALIGALCALAVEGVITGAEALAPIIGIGSLLLGGQIAQSGVTTGATVSATNKTTVAPVPTVVKTATTTPTVSAVPPAVASS
jgi:hypothetical protein